MLASVGFHHYISLGDIYYIWYISFYSHWSTKQRFFYNLIKNTTLLTESDMLHSIMPKNQLTKELTHSHCDSNWRNGRNYSLCLLSWLRIIIDNLTDRKLCSFFARRLLRNAIIIGFTTCSDAGERLCRLMSVLCNSCHVSRSCD